MNPTTVKYKYPKYQYILYDGRARAGDTDDAEVMECSETFPKRVPDDYGDDCIWARLEIIDAKVYPPVYGKELLLWEIPAPFERKS